jgi:hypothetical protein
MVEHMGILTPAQGGFRQNKSTDINSCKLYGLTKRHSAGSSDFCVQTSTSKVPSIR